MRFEHRDTEILLAYTIFPPCLRDSVSKSYFDTARVDERCETDCVNLRFPEKRRTFAAAN